FQSLPLLLGNPEPAAIDLFVVRAQLTGGPAYGAGLVDETGHHVLHAHGAEIAIRYPGDRYALLDLRIREDQLEREERSDGSLRSFETGQDIRHVMCRAPGLENPVQQLLMLDPPRIRLEAGIFKQVFPSDRAAIILIQGIIAA